MKNSIELYLIRHGESELNKYQDLVKEDKKIIWGRTMWANLTPNGVRQSKDSGQYLKSQAISFDRISVSPSIRAMQTMRHCMEEMVGSDNLCVTLSGVDVSNDINEHYMGDYEGRKKSEVNVLDFRSMLNKGELEIEKSLTWKAPGGESIREMITRTGNYVKSNITGWDGKNVGLFTHRGTITWLCVSLSALTINEAIKLDSKNGSVRKLSYANGVWRYDGSVFDPQG